MVKQYVAARFHHKLENIIYFDFLIDVINEVIDTSTPCEYCAFGEVE